MNKEEICPANPLFALLQSRPKEGYDSPFPKSPSQSGCAVRSRRELKLTPSTVHHELSKAHPEIRMIESHFHKLVNSLIINFHLL